MVGTSPSRPMSARGGITSISVAAKFTSTTMFWFGVQYLMEEVSTWRADQLENVAVNSRYLFAGHIVRQQWDNFRRETDGLQAYRVQGKTPADFAQKHPGFVQHWDPGTFGQAWLPDYPSAPPERRPDLDLRGSRLPLKLKAPLALAFYWIRWFSPGDRAIPVFLPGFKADRLVEVTATSEPVALGTRWRTSLLYPALSRREPSVVTALISPDRHLSQIAFGVHTSLGSGRGTISQEGCDGAAVPPRS
jgi:hypothetical protein